MDFSTLAKERYSCRSYDSERRIEEDKLLKILNTARLAPSACNGQPYHITVCRGELKNKIAEAVQDRGLNKFAPDADIILVISERPYVRSAEIGAKFSGNDYRSMDIGILSAYITAAAAELGIGSCIIGWFRDEQIRALCSLDSAVRLCITLGYPKEWEGGVQGIPEKRRLALDELVDF